MARVFWNLSAHTLPARRPQLLIFPKQLHQVGINYSSLWTYGGHSQTTTFHSPNPCRLVAKPQCKIHSVQLQKPPQPFTASTQFKNPKFEISSDSRESLNYSPLEDQKQTAHFECAMAQNVLVYPPKGENRSIGRKDWINARPKPSRANSNPAAPYLMLKGSDDSLLPASLVTTRSSLLDCFHSLSADPLGRGPTALESRTSWSLQHILGFMFVASHNSLSGPPPRDAPCHTLGLSGSP